VNGEDGTVVVLRRRAAEVGCGCHGWNAAGVWSCDGDALVARGGCCCAEQASRRRGGVRQICCNGVECLLAVVLHMKCGGCHGCAVVCGAGAAEVGGGQRGCADLQWKAVLVIAAAGFAPAFSGVKVVTEQ